MGGTAVVDFTLMSNPQEVLSQQAGFLNCSMDVSSQQVVECLQRKSADEIINSSSGFYVSF